MAAFYAEIKDEVVLRNGRKVAPGFYRFPRKARKETDTATNSTNLLDSMPSRLAYGARRIWIEEDDRVSFVKNRLDPIEVDLEEFMWIKLSAKNITD